MSEVVAESGLNVRCLPELIAELDSCNVPPQTVEEAQPWVDRWRRVEQARVPVMIGIASANLITPECILVLVRTKKYRQRRRTTHTKFTSGALERMRVAYLQAPQSAQFTELGRQLEAELGISADAITAAMRHRWREWELDQSEGAEQHAMAA